MCLQFLQLLAFSSSFPARSVPVMGSMSSVHSEMQRCRWHGEQDQQDSTGVATHSPFLPHIGYYSFFSRVPDSIA